MSVRDSSLYLPVAQLAKALERHSGYAITAPGVTLSKPQLDNLLEVYRHIGSCTFVAAFTDATGEYRQSFCTRNGGHSGAHGQATSIYRDYIPELAVPTQQTTGELADGRTDLSA